MGGAWRKDIAFFSIFFYMGKIGGLLPVSKNPHIGHDSNADCFGWSAWGSLATIAQLFLVASFGYDLSPSMNLNKPENKMYIYLWLQSWISAFTTLFIALLTRPKVVKVCMSQACKIYSLPTLPIKPFSTTLFLTMMIYPFWSMVYLSYWAVFLHPFITIYFFKYNYMYIPVATVEILFSCCCIIAERAFTDVNVRMKQLQRQKYDKFTFPLIKELLDKYIKVCEFVERFSVFFSPHLLNSFTSYTVRMIIYSVLFVHAINAKENLNQMFLFAFLSSYLTIRLIFICYWCQKVKTKSTEIISYIRYFRILRIEEITADQLVLLDTYEDLMKTLVVEFTGCGLFPVNIQQILNIIGLIITYAIVAIQTN